MKRSATYWTCQLVGWFMLATANTLMAVASHAPTWKLFASYSIQCGTGLIYTHLLRIVIKRWKWIEFPLTSLIPAVVLATFTVAIVWHLTVLTIIGSILSTFPYPRMLLDIAFGTAFGESATVLIWSLIYFGLHYFERYKMAEIERWKLEVAVKDAELKALKTQMNPHFIFNCLNSVRALIAEDRQRAQEVVTQLARILRYSLQSANNHMVSFADELQTIEDYLALESMRFEDRLRVRMDIDPASLAVSIPPMLLQTLVENAIKHGVAKLPKGGEIFVRSKVTSDELTVAVMNSGQIHNGTNSTGIGMSNASGRLKLLFGDKASVMLANSSAETVTATVRIPVTRKQHESSNH